MVLGTVTAQNARDAEVEAIIFAVVRRGKVKPGMASEFTERIRTSAVPMMKKMAGFRHYYLIVGGDDVIAVSIFRVKSAAEESVDKLLPWIRENLGPLLASPPELMQGEVIISEASDLSR